MKHDEKARDVDSSGFGEFDRREIEQRTVRGEQNGCGRDQRDSTRQRMLVEPHPHQRVAEGFADRCGEYERENSHAENVCMADGRVQFFSNAKQAKDSVACGYGSIALPRNQQEKLALGTTVYSRASRQQ